MSSLLPHIPPVNRSGVMQGHPLTQENLSTLITTVSKKLSNVFTYILKRLINFVFISG